MWQTNAKGNVLGGSTHLVSGLVLELQLDIPPNVPTQHTTHLLTFSVFVVMLWLICDCRSHRNIALFLPTLLLETRHFFKTWFPAEFPVHHSCFGAFTLFF